MGHNTCKTMGRVLETLCIEWFIYWAHWFRTPHQVASAIRRVTLFTATSCELPHKHVTQICHYIKIF